MARAALTLPEPDRSDFYGEIRRQEIRTWLRSIPQAERDALLLTEDDRKRLPDAEAQRLPKATDEIRQAILSAPAAMSGMQEPLWQRLYDAEVEKHHAGRSAALEAEAEALANVEATVAVATQLIHPQAIPAPAQ